MSQVIETPKLTELGSEDLLFENTVQQDVSEIIQDNYREAQQSDGFSDGRTMRKTASLDVVDYLIALQDGYALDEPDPMLLQKELRRYLRERGKDYGMQTVRHILTPGGNANIIIK